VTGKNSQAKIPTPNYKFLPQNIAKKKAVCYTEIEEGGESDGKRNGNGYYVLPQK